MYRGGGSRGRGRGGSYRGRGGSSSSATRLQRGLFADGIWQCNCTPRLPAEHFKVKKEGKNQGRWFYTCQKSKEQGCGFFLWDEDAKPREEAAVLSGKRTEPMGRMSMGDGVGGQEGWSAGRATGGGAAGISGNGMFAATSNRPRSSNMDLDTGEETESPSPSPPPSAHQKLSAAANTGLKRNAREALLDADEDGDDAFPWPLTGQEEQELVKATETTAQAAGMPETPQKTQKTGVYATPATTGKRKLPWLDNPKQTLTTPSGAGKRMETFFGGDTQPRRPGAVSPITEESLSTPSAPRAEPEAAPVSIVPTTPSPPTRQKDALLNPEDSQATLTSETLAALEPAKVPPDIRAKVRTILSKHDLRTQGLRKGRDMSRLALKAKEAKIAELEAKIAGLENARIAELQTRIASLEAEREVDRAVIRQLRTEAEENGRSGVTDSQETIV